MQAKTKKTLVALAVLFWCGGTVASIAVLGRYEFTPGDPGEPISAWPEKLPFAFNPNKLNLIAAVHPHCPCSVAGLAELRKALAQKPAAADVHIVFYQPAGAAAEWRETELVQKTAALAGAKLWFDTDGKIAHMLGARTSFDVFLFGKKREILFRGGLTRGRGIYGDNPGRAALEAHLAGTAAKPSAPVYGCPLQKNPRNTLRKV